MMERGLAATSNSVLRQSGGGRESDSKRERETCLHHQILKLPKNKRLPGFLSSTAAFWQESCFTTCSLAVGIALFGDQCFGCVLSGEKLQFQRQMGKLNPAALGNVRRHGKEQLMGQENRDPRLGASQEKQQCAPGSSLTNSLLSMSGFAPK